MSASCIVCGHAIEFVDEINPRGKTCYAINCSKCAFAWHGEVAKYAELSKSILDGRKYFRKPEPGSRRAAMQHAIRWTKRSVKWVVARYRAYKAEAPQRSSNVVEPHHASRPAKAS